MKKKEIGIAVGIIILLSGIISIGVYFNSINNSSAEFENAEQGFQQWEKNVLEDKSEEGAMLRAVLTTELEDLLNLKDTLNNSSKKILEDTKAAIELSEKIPMSSKISLYKIDQTVKESKEAYSIKFVDEEGKTLKDEKGNEMIYHDKDKIVLSKSKGSYQYVLMRGDKVIPHVYGEKEVETGKVLDITTVPITYISDEKIAKTLYGNISVFKTGSTKLNIRYEAPLSKKSIPWNHRFTFDIVVKD